MRGNQRCRRRVGPAAERDVRRQCRLLLPGGGETLQQGRHRNAPDDAFGRWVCLTWIICWASLLTGSHALLSGAKDVTETRRWIQWNLDSYQQYGFGLWVASLKPTKQFAGHCGLWSKKSKDGKSCGPEDQAWLSRYTPSAIIRPHTTTTVVMGSPRTSQARTAARTGVRYE